MVVFARLGRGSYRSAFETLADSSRVQQARVTQEELRGVLEAIGCEPRFGEDVTLDIGGCGLRISIWHIGLVVVVQIIRPKALQSHMRPPGVVPASKFCAQERLPAVLSDGRKAKAGQGPETEARLYQEIGRMTMEVEYLKHYPLPELRIAHRLYTLSTVS